MLEEDEKSPQPESSSKASLSLGQDALDKRNHVPDILDCLADLSSDEVFTPPELANQVLDQLPEEVWSNPDLRWLDPAVKTGVFLREAARRLMTGLEEVFPDEDERREHIFKNMLFGIAITELTGYVSRRSLYYTKSATHNNAVVRFDQANGNIFFEAGKHDFDKKGNCKICGAPKSLEENRKGMENYAYPFLHNDKIFTDMKFDVIIGNPPYQIETGGYGSQASPLYHIFVQKALDLDPQYVSFIIPSRWYSGGMGLDQFRENMLNNRSIRALVDCPLSSEIFPGVEVKGGICYFLYDRDYNDDCLVSVFEKGSIVSSLKRDLREGGDVFIRSNQAIEILRKVQNTEGREKGGHTKNNFSKSVSSINPFDIPSNFSRYEKTKSKSTNIKIYLRGATGWINKNKIKKNKEYIHKYKVFVSKAYGAGEGFPHQIIGKPIVSSPPSVCSMTYIIAGTYNSSLEAKNAASYMKTKIFRFLVLLRKNTQNTSKNSFAFVPSLPMDRKTPWTDKELYKRYGLTEEEIAHIEATIKEME